MLFKETLMLRDLVDAVFQMRLNRGDLPCSFGVIEGMCECDSRMQHS